VRTDAPFINIESALRNGGKVAPVLDFQFIAGGLNFQKLL